MTYPSENTWVSESMPEMDREIVNDPEPFHISQQCEHRTGRKTLTFRTTERLRGSTESKDIVQASMEDSGIGNSDSVNHLCYRLDSIDMQDENRQPEERNGGHQCTDTGASSHRTIDAINVYSQDKDGDTLLHTGIILRELTLVMLFINLAPSYAWLSIKNFLLQTPLILAVLTRQIEVVRRLIVGGADITSRDREGNTALHIACREGYADVAQALLEPVRYIETKQNSYEIPYQKVPQNLEILNYDGLTCLHLAASAGHLNIVELLLKNGADVNGKDAKTGRSILHNACIAGNLTLVRLLLKCRDVNINMRTYDDFTPFDLARARGHNDVIVELATAGARYDVSWCTE